VNRAAACLLIGAFVTALASPALADDTPIAESLFQQGLGAMERGEYARACGLLAESQRLDPGGGTLLNLALCHERAGKVATAWARFHDALGIARRDARVDRITFATAKTQERRQARVPSIRSIASASAEGSRTRPRSLIVCAPMTSASAIEATVSAATSRRTSPSSWSADTRLATAPTLSCTSSR
jgi:hypothetical protein